MPVFVRRLLLVLAAWALAAPASAQEAPMSPASYFPPSDIRPKEFTLARKDGVFHIFYLRENLIPGAPSQRSFGHATSRDLYFWTEQDTILPVVEGTFEETQVWAPSLHLVDSTYYLFYPGMRNNPAQGYFLAQSITYATSTDLYNWTRRETPLFGTELFPWAYLDTTNAQGRDCRDPYLWWDAASGEWLLYVATRPASQPQSMVIGIAGSSDLETWVDRGSVPISLPSSSFSDVAESPHLFTRDGSLLYILWTTNSGQQLTYGTSPSALSGWGNSRRLRAMLGHTTVGWWGSEIVEADGRTYFACVHNTWIGFWDMHWTAPDSFALEAPDPLQLLGARFDRDSAAIGDTVVLVVAAVNGNGRTVDLEYTAPDSGNASVDAAALGLPASVVLTGESTWVSATVGLPKEVTSLRVAVRAPGSPPAAPSVLKVQSPEPEPPDPEPFPGEEPTVDPVPPTTRALIQFSGEVRFVRDNAPRGFCVVVYDVRGRRLWSERGGPGTRTLVWRPNSAGVATAPPGVYFARVTVPGVLAAETLKVPRLAVR